MDAILEEDREQPRKQRHTAKRIYQRLRDEHGFSGGYTPAPAGGAGGYHGGRRLPGAADAGAGRSPLMETPQVLLDHHWKALRLPTFLREI